MINNRCKLIATLLSIAMLIALMPAAAFAANNIQLNKSAYSINEPMNVKVTGLTQEQTNSRTYVSIYKTGARPDQYGKWERVNSLIAGEWSVNAPAEPGNYEMRVYSADPATDADLVDSAPFTVKYFTENNITVKLNKSIYDAEEEMTVIVSGATNEQINSKAYVAIYKAGARADQWGSWERIRTLIAGEWKVKTPKEAGNYEMRVYVVDPPVDDALIAIATFSAGTGVAPPAAPVITTPAAAPAPASTAAPAAAAQQAATLDAAPAATSEPASSTAAGAAVGAPQVLTVESGIKLEWPAVPGAAGYRVYRSRTSGAEGMSVTDFMITSINYVDVNVDANTMYYYTIRAVMKEASAATGEREQLGEPSPEISATTGSSILGGNASDMGEGIKKNVILMKLDDPYMSVNGIRQEVDPGRGTAPSLVSDRTMVPLRSVAETMGGTVQWDEKGEQDIYISGGGNTVEMWLGRKDLIVNGENKEMDVAPSTINDRTMVPVRFVAENLGCAVDWLSSTLEIVIVFYTGGTPPASVTTPASTTTPEPAQQTPVPTPTPAPAQQSGGNDAVSVNALEGAWFWYDGWFSAYLWRFDTDGNYVRFKVSQTGYTNTVGTTWYSAYGNIMTGNYSVSGYTIKLYNNQQSSQFSQDFNIGSVPPHNTAVGKLPPLSSPSGVEDITMEFEFTDAMTLRLATDTRPLYDDYDTEFEYYDGDSHNVALPSHQIPSRGWPAEFVPKGVPEISGGRIRKYSIEDGSGSYDNEDDGMTHMVPQHYATIYIDQATQAPLTSFVESLLRDGWTIGGLGAMTDAHGWYYSNDYPSIDVVSIVKGSEGSGQCWLQKGYSEVIITFPVEDGKFQITTSWLEI